jgi:hypothetical protein
MSTLKTDTIVGAGGNNEVTFVNNKFTGTASGNITLPGEGGTVTTNLQQGLAKYWTQFNGTSSVATVDSLNQGGLTDNGTGDYTISFTNNMSNNDFSPTTGTKTHEEMVEAVATSTVQILTMNSSGSSVDDTINSITVHGDLA